MTKGEKELLLKDLSARLPYGVKIHIEHDVFYDEIEPYDSVLTPKILNDFLRMERLEVKPYLRPMSSMTMEEDDEYENCCWDNLALPKSHFYRLDIWENVDYLHMDWINSHHFDYRGLIEKELALVAPDGMYNIQTE